MQPTSPPRHHSHRATPLVQSLERRALLDGAQFEPPRFLLGDVHPAPVAGSETEMQVAAGGGGFLAVWVDNRSAIGTERLSPLNAGLPGGGTVCR